MLIKKIFISFLMFFSMAVYAESSWIVKDIQVYGLKNFSKNETLKKIHFRVGSMISSRDVKNSINSLFQTGQFKDIKVIYSDSTIIFHVKEKPIISYITLSGGNIIDHSVLNEYLKKIHMQKGDIFNPFLAKILIEKIKDFYHNLGRYQANIKILTFFSENNHINLKIIIDEGVATKINNIKIFGNKNFSEKKIISLFQLKNRSPWWNFVDKNTYFPQTFSNDLERLKRFYLNQGYFHFHIDKKEVKFSKDKTSVNITLTIFEGDQYKIPHFFVNSNILLYKKCINNIINIENNELFNQDKIKIIIQKIKKILSEYGYINPEIVVEPEINQEKKTIILYFNINKKKRYFVKRIDFVGNELTMDEVLRREIKQMEGKYFNAKLVESGKEALEKTRYFSNVQVMENVDSNSSNQVIITYKVKEESTGSINFGLGYGMDSGISFNTSFAQKNILGSGNSIKASAIKNDHQKYADIAISYPYFINNYTDLNTRFFYNDLKYNLNSISDLTKNTYGFESNLGFLINNNNRVNFGFGYTHNNIINTEKKDNTFLSMKRSSNKNFSKDGLVNDFTINYSWIYDSLKYFYFPFSGNQTYISGKNTIPGSDNNFYKIILDSEQYIPLNKKQNFIFLSHLHMGLGNSFNKGKLPFYENFFADSINTIRGFRMNTIGPKKNYDNSHLKNCIGYKNHNVCESIDSVGGNSTIISNLELITPMPFVHNQYSKLLRSSFFLDAGNIWDIKWKNIKNMNLNNIYVSYGFALQWFSPIGPLVFSYAFPLQNNKNHQLEAFQFNFGKNW